VAPLSSAAKLHWRWERFDRLTTHGLYAAMRLRHEVFVVEQRRWTSRRVWRTAPSSRPPTCTTSTRCPDLLHGQEERVYGDCAYALQQELIRGKASGAQDFTNKTMRKGSVTEASNGWSTAPSPACVPESSTCSLSSSDCGIRQGALPRTGQQREAGIRGTALANIFLARRSLAA
jgi:hypothetical protein